MCITDAKAAAWSGIRSSKYKSHILRLTQESLDTTKMWWNEDVTRRVFVLGMKAEHDAIVSMISGMAEDPFMNEDNKTVLRAVLAGLDRNMHHRKDEK